MKDGLVNPCSTRLPKGDSDQTSNTGVWKWRNLVSQGVLVPGNVDGVWVGGQGWEQRLDMDTISPYVWNNITGEFITYDDPVSLSYKREASAGHGLQGMMLWEIPYDTNQGELMSYMS